MDPIIKDSARRKRIKIAHVITRLDWSGSPDIIRIMCQRLDPRVYDVTLIYGYTSHPSEKTTEFLKKFDGRTIVIPYLKRDVSLIEDIAALIRLWLIFLRERFDVVHTHTAKAGFVGRLAAKSAGVPLVAHTPHGHDFYGYFGSLGSRLVIILERIAALFADKIIVFTDIEKKDMLKYHICPSKKIEIIPSGIKFCAIESVKQDAAKKRAEFGIGPDDFVVGMIGRLESVKGFEYFIDSAKIVSDAIPRTKFLIVGDGSLRSELVERSKRLNMEEKIIFTGWREDVPEIMAILDILVLASLNEAVGRVILEAGAAGKPVVATAVGGVPEIIDDNKTGLLVPSSDAGAIARAVIGLLKDGNKRREMGEAAKIWIKKNFDEDKMMSELESIYRGGI